MNRIMSGLLLSALAAALAACGGDSSSSKSEEKIIEVVPEACKGFVGSDAEAIVAIAMKSALGKKLFHDKNLSLDGNQSCASCHNPEKGFIDDRPNLSSQGSASPAGSLGDNEHSIGDRNAPTAGYAAFSPHFKCGTRQRVASQRTSKIGDYEGFLGGQFWDGRAANLKGQAGGPPTNPGEMNMPSKASVVERLKENDEYVSAFENLYAANILEDVEAAYEAMTESIAAFETFDKAAFFPFDSKYDRSLLLGDEAYEYPVGSKAGFGKTLFFSSDLTCAACHQLREIGNKGEVFTSFEYHNIGTPENKTLRNTLGNNVAVGAIDEGLFLNPAVTSENEKGKFKVPTLRNIAVTAPYMHNGVFNELETVIKFYQHAKRRANGQVGVAGELINPETGLEWQAPEVNQNLANNLLGGNDINLDDKDVEALECFFLSLTDARYEHLLDATKVANCGL